MLKTTEPIFNENHSASLLGHKDYFLRLNCLEFFKVDQCKRVTLSDN